VKPVLNIGLIGHRFMGRAHSHALREVAAVFDLPFRPVMKTLCGRRGDLAAAAERFGWERWTDNWRSVVEDPGIDVVDICAPGNLHAEIAIAAAQNGKHVLCEKPLALDAGEAARMYDEVVRRRVVHMVNFNFRRVPALAFAKQLLEGGRLGRVVFFEATYRQDWPLDPSYPFVWRMDRPVAGAGSMADKGSHLVDLARWLCGEFESVSAATEIFVKERPLPEDPRVRREVTTDDAAVFTARFSGGALGLFGTSRMSAGHKNGLWLEVNGTRGSLRFDLERLNELEVYFAEEDGDTRAFRRIMVTEPTHPYVRSWWPPGHVIGWEHTIVHQYAEFISAIGRGEAVAPDFRDGLRAQQVLDAIEAAAREQRWVAVPKTAEANA
jgi:predicted dehydrogenase